MNTTAPDTQPNDAQPNDAEQVKRPRAAKLLRTLAIPIIVFWVLLAVVTNVFVPSIEKNTAANAEAEVPRDAPSSQAAIVEGQAFHESDFTSAGAILMETQGRKLGEQEHRYY